jgi:hypothetical protein
MPREQGWRWRRFPARTREIGPLGIPLGCRFPCQHSRSLSLSGSAEPAFIGESAPPSRPLPLCDSSGEHPDGPCLQKVEIRTVLDSMQWAPPTDPKKLYYGIIEGRRAWIVRDQVIASAGRHPFYPCLLSSRGMEELIGWVNQVAISEINLSNEGFEMLAPFLKVLSREDRMQTLNMKDPELFTKKARERLLEIRSGKLDRRGLRPKLPVYIFRFAERLKLRYR